MCDVLLSWLPPTGGGVLNFFIYRGTTGNFSEATLIGATPLPTFVDDPPEGGVPYWYWVRSMPNPATCAQLGGLAASNWASKAWLYRDNVQVAPHACGVMRIQWEPLRGATTYQVQRRRPLPDGTTVFDAIVATSVVGPLVFDATGAIGGRYHYVVFPEAACESTSYGDFIAARFPDAPDQHVWGDSVNAGSDANLSVNGDDSAIATTYQWRRGSTPLANSTKYAGTSTASLSIRNVTPSDEGVYTVIITNACGTTTHTAVLVVTEACRADFNSSGAVSVQDIFDFLAAYFAGCP